MTHPPSTQASQIDNTLRATLNTYDAFLSYRSVTDYDRARKIETFLESFHRSASSRSLTVRQLQICRDGSDFTLPRRHDHEVISTQGVEPGGDEDPIWQIIQAELSKAQYLLVLCSPGAVSSTYVSKEICWFLANRGKEWIIPVVTEGADPKNKPEECFPADIISNRLHESLIWYDLRGLKRSKTAAGIKNCEDEMVRLAADLLSWDASTHGPLSAIWQREQSKRRRRQSFLMLMVAILFLGLGGYALVSARQRQQALRRLENTLRDNAQLIGQRDKEVAERERVANERDRIQDERDKALAGEKIQADKAIKAALIAEERRQFAVKQQGIAEDRRREAEKQTNIAIARQLAARAQYLRSDRTDSLPNTMSMAVQSMRRLPSLEADQLLRSGFALLSHPTSQMSVAGDLKVSAMAINPVTNEFAMALAPNRQGPNTIPDVIELRDEVGGNENNIVRLKQAGKDVTSLAFSSDGLRLLAITKDHHVTIWNVKSATEITHITPADFHGGLESKPIISSPNMQYLAARYSNHGIKVLEIESDKEILDYWHSDSVTSYAFSNDSGRLVTTQGRVARVWDIKRRTQPAQFTHTGLILGAAFSPDGEYLVTAGQDGVHLWDIRRATDLMQLERGEIVYRVIFSPDGKYLATVTRYSGIQVWEVLDGRLVGRMTHKGLVLDLAFSSDSKYLASLDQNNVLRVWNPAGNEREVVRITHGRGVSKVMFSAKANSVITATSPADIKVWEVVSTRETVKVGSASELGAIGFTSDNSSLLMIDRDRTFTEWGFAAANKVQGKKLEEHDQALLSANGRSLALIRGGTLKILSVPELQTIQTITHAKRLWGAVFSRDARYIAARSEGDHVLVWEVQTKKRLDLAHQGRVNFICFSPNGEYITTASDDKTARVWRVGDGQQVSDIKHQSAVMKSIFSPDSRYLATVSAHSPTARVYTVSNGRETAQMKHDAPVMDITFSSDGRFLASASEDFAARIFKVFNGDEVARMTHSRAVKSVVFSPDGKYLATLVRGPRDPEEAELMSMALNQVYDPLADAATLSNEDYAVRIWETSSGTEVGRVAHSSEVSGVAFSIEGKYLVSTDVNSTWVSLWLPNDLIKMAGQLMTDNSAKYATDLPPKR